jgi:hypothetical protein
MRGVRIERSFSHLYETGDMRRTHLRGHVRIPLIVNASSADRERQFRGS